MSTRASRVFQSAMCVFPRAGVSDKLYDIKILNRDSTFLRNGFVLSQLDGEGMRQMGKQQEMASKEPYKEHLLKEIVENTVTNIHDLRNDSHQEMRTDRVEKAEHFDMSQDDGVTMTASSGVQAEPSLPIIKNSDRPLALSTNIILRQNLQHTASRQTSNIGCIASA